MSNFINILACSGNNCCSDYKLVNILDILHKSLKLMQFIVPILLIIMLIIQITKMVANPDEEKNTRGIIKTVIAVFIFFMLPTIVNLIFTLVPANMELSTCWKQVENTKAQMKNNKSTLDYDDGTTYKTKSNKKSNSKKKANKRKKTTPTKKKSNHKLRRKKSINALIARNRKKIVRKLNSKYSGSKKGKKIVAYARKFLGNRYCWGGKNPHKCADCSGYVAYVFNHFGVPIISSSASICGQTNLGKHLSRKSIKNGKVKAGDIIVYYGHVAIATGHGRQIIHASDERSGIKLSDTYSYKPIRCVLRIDGVN